MKKSRKSKKMNKLLLWFGKKEELHYWRIWLLFFIFSAFMAFLIQLVILPYVFPAWNAGDGLLAGGDWYSFHLMAVQLAEKIHTLGWSVWELRPQGQGPSGIAGAIYALTIPKPWVLIPLNAAMHATAGILLLKIVSLFTSSQRVALVSSIPFIFFPSTMTWVSQIHKDGYTILGNMAFMFGWALLARRATWRGLKPLWVILTILGGVVITWSTRPYQVQLLQVISVVVTIGLGILYLIWAHQGIWQYRQALFGLVLCTGLVFSLTPFTKGGISIEEPETSSIPAMYSWNSSGRLPSAIENRISSLSLAREEYISTPGGSNIDTNIHFHTIWDFLGYIP